MTSFSMYVWSLVVLISSYGRTNADSNIVTNPNKQLIRLLSSGPIPIVWDTIIDSETFPGNLSSECASSLNDVKNGLNQGSRWAFNFLDSSSKGIAGNLEITLSDFGDFDQCLEVAPPVDKFTGQHCMVNLVYTNESSAYEESEIMRDAIMMPGNQQIFLSYGFCAPSTCSEEDIKSLISEILINYPVKVKEDFPIDTSGVTCVTKFNTSWWYRLDPRNMTTAQIVSILFIVSLIGFVTLSTQIHIAELAGKHFMNLDIKTALPGEIVPVVNFTRHFSIINSITELVSVESLKGHSFAPDTLKVGVVLAGVLAHASIYLESNLGFLTVTRINILWKFFGSLYTQPVGSPGSFDLFDITAGFLVIYGTFEVIQNGRFNLFRSFSSRWIRHLPTLLVLLALDFMWPIFTPSGPLVEMASREVIGKCSRNWWRPILMMANTQTLSDSCIMHTFFAAVDFQLFFIGIIAVYCFTKNERLGYIFCGTGSIIGTLLLYLNAQGIRTPVLVEASPDVWLSHEFLHKVHFSTVGHIHNYFLGILIGYKLKTGWRLYQPSRTTFVIVNGTSFAILISCHFIPALHNIFHLIPKEYFPHFIIVTKMLYGACWGTIAVTVHHYHEDLASIGKSTLREALIEGSKRERPENLAPSNLTSSDSASEKLPSQSMSCERLAPSDLIKDENNNKMKTLEGVVEFDVSLVLKWLTKVLGEVAYSAHMVNLLYLRTSFMTTKVHLSMDPVSVATRAVVACINCMILGIIFHLYFSAPFDSLRRQYLSTRTKIKTADEKSD